MTTDSPQRAQPNVGGEAKTFPYSTVQATAEAIIAQGIASAGQLRAALDSLNDFASDPASVCGSPRLFQAWSRRPVV
jgi:hypothetical protein